MRRGRGVNEKGALPTVERSTHHGCGCCGTVTIKRTTSLQAVPAMAHLGQHACQGPHPTTAPHSTACEIARSPADTTGTAGTCTQLLCHTARCCMR